MAKKYKNKNRKITPNPATEPAQSPASTFSSSQAFNPDYSYVIKDLKQIGLLAVIFVAMLVGISFIV